jgi:hypothetical protein
MKDLTTPLCCDTRKKMSTGENQKTKKIMIKRLMALVVLISALGHGQLAVAKKIHNYKKLIIGDKPKETFIIGTNTDFYQHADIGVIGTGKLVVKGKLFLTGHLYVAGKGKFAVKGGELHIKGNDTNIYVGEKGKIIFRNRAFLHYVQTYVAQHNIIAWGRGSVRLVNTTVDCDGSIEFIYLTESSSYTAERVTYKHWKTWYLWDQTTLTLEDVNIAGDIVFYDSPTMSFTNTDVIMPWLYLNSGAAIDYEFPKPTNPDDPVTMTFDSNLPGVSGIDWTLKLENCRYIAWGITPYPGSDVTVRNSDLTMIMYRFTGKGTFDLKGIMVNGSTYKDTTVPVTDRNLRLVDTNVKWWKVDVVDDFELKADSIVFSEMVSKNNARAYLINSTCEGQTIHLGCLDNSFIHFKDGEVWSYVSAWSKATLVLENSLVDWEKGKFIYQKSNIAHGNSRLYCLNSKLKIQPQAYGEALVMFARIDSPDTGSTGSSIEIPGSAWIEAGPESSVTFNRYELAWAPKRSSDWTVIKKSKTSVKDGTLGTWNTSGLSSGKYRLRLKVWTSGYSGIYPPKDFPAYKKIRLLSHTLQRNR